MGAKVRELREAKGMTQEELAAAIGVPVSTIMNIEDGKEQQILVGICRKIAHVLDVNPDYLLLAE